MTEISGPGLDGFVATLQAGGKFGCPLEVAVAHGYEIELEAAVEGLKR